MLSTAGLLIAPGLMWGWLFYRLHRYQRASLRRLAALFVGGMCCGLIALLLNHSVEKYTLFWPGAEETFLWMDRDWPLYKAGFWMLVGFNEETAKLLVLLLLSFPTRHLREPFDGILHGAVVALGFATLENGFYLQQYGVGVVATRTVVTLPAHAFMSVPLGYFVAKARLRQLQGADAAAVTRLLLGGWLIAAVLHGTYDLLLSFGFSKWAYAQIALMGLFSLWLGVSNWRHSAYLPSLHKSEPSNRWLAFLLGSRS